MSLLLDALKQAEKTKKEKTHGKEDSVDQSDLSLEENTGQIRQEQIDKTIAQQYDEIEMPGTEEMSIDFSMDNEPTVEGTRKKEARAAAEATAVIQGEVGFSGGNRLSPEESQTLKIDLEKFAEDLASSTGPMGRVADTEQQPMVGEGSITMPSMKSMQASMDDFYGESTSELSQPEVRPADDMGASPGYEGTGATTRPSQHSQQAAQGVFDAKQKTGASLKMWLSLVVVLLLLAGGGGYFYLTSMEGQSFTPPVARPVPQLPAIPSYQPPSEMARVAVPPGPVPGDEPAQTQPVVDTVAKPALEPVAVTPEVAQQELALAEQVEEVVPAAPAADAVQPQAVAEAPSPVPPVTAPVQAARQQTAQRLEDVAPIRIKRRSRTDQHFARLQQAYQAFKQGDYARAEKVYRQVLQDKPNNRDALRGLAAVHMQNGDAEEASEIYTRLLYLNPKDRVALTALTAMQGAIDPVGSESRIKLLLDKEPNAPWLHFTLGNMYALQSRWADAQQSYFRAWNGDPENGDYLYNLAVALDHLGQSGVALDFYRKALKSGETRSSAFDRRQAEKRIRELSSSGDKPKA